ncbi:MAG: hypothetical protein EOP33_03215 [Rickettsiaceae bacterium]|nr:MAG: hypothetical protein EOP33_03215 [Rickettsiaceae bacterium]
MIKTVYEEFDRVGLHSSTVILVKDFPKTSKPALKVWVDFDQQTVILNTFAQVIKHCNTSDLIN